MNYLVFSDLHGSIIYAKKVIDEFNSGKYDMMLCLGDILYHGPRNDLPEGYNPKEVVKLLNLYKDKIIAVEGNCDAYVDHMVLDFKIHSRYEFDLDEKKVIMTHGHLNGPTQPFDVKDAIVLYGHTHIHKMDNINGVMYLNPGSTTIPKEGQENSFAVLNSKKFIVYNFIHKELLNISLN